MTHDAVAFLACQSGIEATSLVLVTGESILSSLSSVGSKGGYRIRGTASLVATVSLGGKGGYRLRAAASLLSRIGLSVGPWLYELATAALTSRSELTSNAQLDIRSASVSLTSTSQIVANAGMERRAVATLLSRSVGAYQGGLERAGTAALMARTVTVANGRTRIGAYVTLGVASSLSGSGRLNHRPAIALGSESLILASARMDFASSSQMAVASGLVGTAGYTHSGIASLVSTSDFTGAGGYTLPTASAELVCEARIVKAIYYVEVRSHLQGITSLTAEAVSNPGFVASIVSSSEVGASASTDYAGRADLAGDAILTSLGGYVTDGIVSLVGDTGLSASGAYVLPGASSLAVRSLLAGTPGTLLGSDTPCVAETTVVADATRYLGSVAASQVVSELAAVAEVTHNATALLSSITQFGTFITHDAVGAITTSCDLVAGGRTNLGSKVEIQSESEFAADAFTVMGSYVSLVVEPGVSASARADFQAVAALRSQTTWVVISGGTYLGSASITCRSTLTTYAVQSIPARSVNLGRSTLAATARRVRRTVTVLTQSMPVSDNRESFSLTASFTTVTGSDIEDATGTVEFYDGLNLLGISDVDPTGIATTIVRGLSPGIHSLFALYRGDINYYPSQSYAISHQSRIGTRRTRKLYTGGCNTIMVNGTSVCV